MDMSPTVRNKSSGIECDFVNPNEVSSFIVKLLKNELEPFSVGS